MSFFVKSGCLRAFRLLVVIAAVVVSAVDRSAATTPDRLRLATDELQKLAEKTLQTTGVPGMAIAVVHKNETVLLRGFGVREVGQSATIDPDTVFQLASVSKPITTSILAILVGEGVIDWDDRVIDRDPGFRLHDAWVTTEVRLRDLLCHRSGLPDHCGDLLEDLGYGRDEILRRLRYQPLAGFRSTYAYTNYGFTEAAVAAARAVGKPWEEIAAEKLYRPLGMTTTSSRYADYAQAPNRALLHVSVDGRWTPKNVRQPDAQAPAGGVSSTLRDMTRWLEFLLADGKFSGRQIATSAALAETQSPQIVTGFRPANGNINCYGLGWNVSIDRGGRTFLKHSGGFDLGVRTEVALLPSEEIGIVVLSNAAPTGLPEAMTESFFDLVVFGELKRDWVEFASRMVALDTQHERERETDFSRRPDSPAAPLAPAAYVGSYSNSFFGDVEIAEAKAGLELRLGPGKLPFVLRPWNRDVFVYQPTGEMAGGPSGVIFSIGPEGMASEMMIENLNVHGQGRFARTDLAK